LGGEHPHAEVHERRTCHLCGGATQALEFTQTVVALSSGEVEFVALVKAVAESMVAQAVALELGWNLGLVAHVDSEAAKPTASPSGIGRARHLEVKTLWVQAALRDGRFVLKKVPAPKTRRRS
jgi:hypothetical protein